jgi:hypothetical protein
VREYWDNKPHQVIKFTKYSVSHLVSKCIRKSQKRKKKKKKERNGRRGKGRTKESWEEGEGGRPPMLNGTQRERLWDL